MAQNTTLILLPQSVYSGIHTVAGTKQPAAAYILGNQDLQTISWSVTSFTGTITISASLATDPGANDWFVVDVITGSSLSEISYVNVVGNYVWLKADVSGFTEGILNHVKVSY